MAGRPKKGAKASIKNVQALNAEVVKESAEKNIEVKKDEVNPVEKVTFSNKFFGMRYTMVPDETFPLPDGQRRFKKGKHIIFENGIFTTSDPEEINFLRTAPEYGKSMIELT